MSNSDKADYRKILLRALEAFSKLCEEQGIRWWMAFGSAIGVARHQGFIPWDDDIDVLMPREDYERFLGLKVHGYSIVATRVPGCGEDCPFSYAKFCDSSTTVWERKMYPSVFGVFIDVFPMDEAGAGVKRLHEKYRDVSRKYKRALRVHYPGEIRHCLSKGNLTGAAKILLDEWWYAARLDHWRKSFLDVEEEAAKGRGDSYVVMGTITSPCGLTMDKNLFAQTLMMPFEGTMVPMPSGYDEILKLFYGDYMQLPPPDKRVSGHYHYFVDLERGLSLQEAVEIVSGREE